MTAEERYEWAWKRYLVRLNENSKIRLTSFLREIHVYQRGMERWMYAKGLSVMETKRLIRESQNRAKYERLLPSSDTTGLMFLLVRKTVRMVLPKPQSQCPESALLFRTVHK